MWLYTIFFICVCFSLIAVGLHLEYECFKDSLFCFLELLISRSLSSKISLTWPFFCYRILWKHNSLFSWKDDIISSDIMLLFSSVIMLLFSFEYTFECFHLLSIYTIDDTFSWVTKCCKMKIISLINLLLHCFML